MLAHALSPLLARRGIHYGWVMIAVTFVVMLSTSAAMGLPGVLIRPLSKEFGWANADVSAPLAVRIALYGLIAPFAAVLIQRFGIRRVVITALALIIAGLALASRVDALWHMWICWALLVGIGTGLTALVLGATVAGRWFQARRGLAVGLLTASSATGQLIFLRPAAWLAEHHGWRMALVPAAVACTLAGVLVLLLVRNHPAELGLAPFGAATTTPPAAARRTGALRALADASGSRTFWLLFFTFFVCGLSTNGLVQMHFIPLCLDFGMPEVEAASVLAMIGAFDFVGTIASGWLSDRVDSRWLLFWYYGLRGLSLMALPLSTFSFYGLSIFGVFYGLDWVATVPPTVKLASSNFGPERAPVIFGWVFCGHMLGAAVATFGGGLSRDALASYLPAFFAAGVLCVAAALAAIGIRRGPSLRQAGGPAGRCPPDAVRCMARRP